ncbi:MAG: immune inhibitor A [Candidatus Eisenbacteria bacterium]|nr:immune inhibitor A [Candidatus Eisenbacteria bacterium]
MYDRTRTTRRARPLVLSAAIADAARVNSGPALGSHSFSGLAMCVLVVCGLALSSTLSSAAAHAEHDPHEVTPPARAEYTRWDLSVEAQRDASLRAQSAGQSAAALLGSPRVSSLVESARAHGLDTVALPPHRSVSSGVSMASALADPASASREVARTDPALVGIDPDDLLIAVVDQVAGLTYVHGRQGVDGLPVLGSHVVFQWDAQGKLRLAGSDVFSPDPLRLQGESRADRSTVRWISESEAHSAALDGMPADVEVTRWEFTERAWYPIPLAEGARGLFADGDGFDLVPVWNLRFQCENPPGRYDVMVDGETGAVLARTSLIRYETFEGTIQGLIEPSSPGDRQEMLGMPEIRYRLRSDTVDERAATDRAGQFQIDVPAGNYQFSTSLVGERVYVENGLFGLVVPSAEFEVRVPSAGGSPSDPVMTWNPDNSLESDRDTYYHTNIAYEEIRGIDSGEGLLELDVSMRAVVDDPSGTCNAYWNGSRMNFYAEGGGCAASARIADVVYHEYGHAVTEFTYAPFSATGTMHEGFSDYFAATIRNDPKIGNGFRGPGTSIRDIEIDRVWPDDLVGESHADGLIIAGALWDLRKRVGREVADHLWHFARYGRSTTFDDYLLDLLVLDDDDADLFNGTPHLEEIVRAFRAHGIGDYSIDLSGAALPDVESPGVTIPVSLRIFSLVPLESSGTALFYSLDGGLMFERAELVPGTLSGEWVTEIPSPPEGTTVYYYWAFTNEFGDVTLSPENAPAGAHSFYVGRDIIAPHVEHFETTAVSGNTERMHLRALVADNSQRLGEVRAEFRVDGGQAHTVPMTVRETTTLAVPTAGSGDRYVEYEATLHLDLLPGADLVEYRILADDTAQSANTGAAPAVGFFQVPVRRGWAGDLETEPGPFEPTGDWEWGVAGEGFAWSGTHVWATNLDGAYDNSTESFLTLGPFDLTDYGRARLEFRHRYRFEREYDGGQIQVRQRATGSWTPIAPDGGYPWRSLDALGGPGFSGESDGWQSVVVPLDHYLGDEAWIRLRVASDVGVTDLGWYVDDIAILEAQAHVDPIALIVQDAMDERIQLSWAAPIGIDLGADRWLGYHVYRRKRGDDRDAEIRLTEEPTLSTRYTDSSDLVNGKTYIYRVTAVHDDGESRGVEIEGQPYAASVSVDVSSVGMNVVDYLPATRTVGVRNLGSGYLAFEVILADAGDTADETVAKYVSSGQEEPVVLVDDPSEGDSVVDISRVSVEELTVGAMPVFRLTIEGDWGDPHDAWGGMIALDTDGNLGTSQGDFELPWGGMVNMGFEYGVVFGNLPRQVGFGDASIEAVLFNATRTQYEILTGVELREDGPITIDVPRFSLGNPSEFRFQLVAGAQVDRPASDFVPDLPEAIQWFRRTPKHGLAAGTGPARVDVTFDAPHAPAGTYHADLLVLSNDRTMPELRVPVTVQVSRTTAPPTPLAQSILPDVRGMEIRFTPSPALAVETIALERQEGNGEWERLDRRPLVADETGMYSYLDRFVREGTTYRYRIPVTLEGGIDHVYGPLEAIFAPSGAPQTFPMQLPALALGSSAEGLELSFELPTVFDPLVGVWIDRRPIGSEEFIPLLEEPLLPPDDRVLRYRDPWSTPFNDGVAPDREYEYRIRIEMPDDMVEYLYAGRFELPLPTELRLLAPRPNPFREQVVVRFDLPVAENVKLEVFDVSGRRRAVLEDGPRIAGTHQVVWDGRDESGVAIASGVYWMRLVTDGGAKTVRMLRTK